MVFMILNETLNVNAPGRRASPIPMDPANNAAWRMDGMLYNPPMAEETSLWKGCTSQLVHFWTYFLWFIVAAGIAVAAVILFIPLLFVALLLPLLGMLARYIITRSTVYELTTQRLRKTSGVFNKQLDELELYRVKDSTLEQPFLLRLFGLGNVMIISSDATMPDVRINGVANAFEVREKLRVAVEGERDRKRVREVDFADDDAHPGH